MPIDNVIQKDVIIVNDRLRLRRFDNHYDFAFDWYQDKDTVHLVDGIYSSYDYDTLRRMYEYLNNKGELYFIEYFENNQFIPIGDVTFSQFDLPIVIGEKSFRGRGIGKAVLSALIKRAFELGFTELNVREVYDFNIASQRLFESVGFCRSHVTDKGFSYTLKLNGGNMNKVLCNLKPERVFYYFEELTKIPRSSFNEKAVSDYLVKFAENLHLEVIQDEVKNVIIRKPGTNNSNKTVILQGHMDMVCVKNDDLIFDFAKDPIPLLVEGDFVKTKGTSLGADNGIALSMIMAILEDDSLKHPPLVAIFTVNEETGMGGVMRLKKDSVKGDILINLDSEEEGIFLSSCAGGLRNNVILPLEYKEANQDYKPFEVSITGLIGGHSGIEINKSRANAIRLLGRVLYSLEETVGIDLATISGGEKTNAIPKKASALVYTKNENDLKESLNELNKHFQKEYLSTDNNILVSFKPLCNRGRVFTDNLKRKVISLLKLLSCGVQTMSAEIVGLVESSVNIGVIETNDKEIIIYNSIRSSIGTLKLEIAERTKVLCDLTGATMEIASQYPEWEYKAQSPIRDLMLKLYKEMYNKEGKVSAIHAGLECGYLKEKIGDIDMISIGPDLYDVHSPNERLSISSTKRVYEFLCEVLKRI